MGTIGLISSCHLQGNSQGVCKQLHPWRLGWGGGGNREDGPRALYLGVGETWPLRRYCLSSFLGFREPCLKASEGPSHSPQGLVQVKVWRAL